MRKRLASIAAAAAHKRRRRAWIAFAERVQRIAHEGVRERLLELDGIEHQTLEALAARALLNAGVEEQDRVARAAEGTSTEGLA